MKKLFNLFIILLSILVVQSYAQTPKYIGASKCKTCHKKSTDGNQFKIWQEGQQANAIKTLAGEEAKKIANKIGIDDPTKDIKCTKCHSTYASIDAKLLDKKTKLTLDEGVSCESCHGPGSAYKRKKIMKDQKTAIAKGLIIPNETTCKKCHNSKSPTWKSFDFVKASDKIKHPRPSK